MHSLMQYCESLQDVIAFMTLIYNHNRLSSVSVRMISHFVCLLCL